MIGRMVQGGMKSEVKSVVKNSTAHINHDIFVTDRRSQKGHRRKQHESRRSLEDLDLDSEGSDTGKKIFHHLRQKSFPGSHQYT